MGEWMRIFLSKPFAEMLPESYFLNDILKEDIIQPEW